MLYRIMGMGLLLPLVCNACAMQPSDLKVLDGVVAQLALQLAGFQKNNIQKLYIINDDDIQRVKKNSCGAYCAELRNGDTLYAECCKDGEILCARFIRTQRGISIDIPVDSSWYEKLKQRAERSYKGN